ncbi:hypothetical protein F4604DRAFT_2042765 [Suillus subluteus]|nr:hypothetical protein F4604DRAFT_2042765 [Suillus subluteus]
MLMATCSAPLTKVASFSSCDSLAVAMVMAGIGALGSWRAPTVLGSAGAAYDTGSDEHVAGEAAETVAVIGTGFQPPTFAGSPSQPNQNASDQRAEAVPWMRLSQSSQNSIVRHGVGRSTVAVVGNTGGGRQSQPKLIGFGCGVGGVDAVDSDVTCAPMPKLKGVVAGAIWSGDAAGCIPPKFNDFSANAG